METFVTVLIVIVSILLGLIVLIQNPKGGGLASGFTGANQIGGVKKTADFLDKATWSLVILLFVLSITATGLEKQVVAVDQGLIDDIVPVQTEQQNTLPAGEESSDDESTSIEDLENSTD
jgi:preprotein translocase subunit SecG